MSATPQPTTHVDQALPQTSELKSLISGLGFEIVDIAGFLDAVQATASDQYTTMRECQSGLTSLTEASEAVARSVASASASSQEALLAVEDSMETMRSSSSSSRSVAAWVAAFDERINAVEESLGNVQSVNVQIASIATQVNILAINAGIEAARAGDAGRGFAIVASAIKELSQSTSKAAQEVADHITKLSTTVQTLKSEALTVSESAEDVLSTASAADEALSMIGTSIRKTADDTANIAQQATAVDDAGKLFAPAFEKMARQAKSTTEGVTQASNRGAELIERSEAIVQHAAILPGDSVDTRFIYYVQDAADKIRDIWEAAIKAGQISRRDLFDTQYQPIPGTNPQQVMTRFTNFTDQTLPPIQEAALAFDPKVVFCAAVDRSGYLPTHNNKFSHPQSDDPVWNASHCRNRRIFDDRVGLKSGQNQKPFLLQVYRRDMGGGKYAMMKDLSAPIFVDGQHWGGLRMAYTFD